MRLISVRSEGDDAAKLLWDSGTAGIGVEASVFVVPEEHRVHTDAVEPLRSRHGVVCISSQVGCSVGCSFCATGRLGRLRNLDVLEMLQQARESAERLVSARILLREDAEAYVAESGPAFTTVMRSTP